MDDEAVAINADRQPVETSMGHEQSPGPARRMRFTDTLIFVCLTFSMLGMEPES